MSQPTLTAVHPRGQIYRVRSPHLTAVRPLGRGLLRRRWSRRTSGARISADFRWIAETSPTLSWSEEPSIGRGRDPFRCRPPSPWRRIPRFCGGARGRRSFRPRRAWRGARSSWASPPESPASTRRRGRAAGDVEDDIVRQRHALRNQALVAAGHRLRPRFRHPEAPRPAHPAGGRGPASSMPGGASRIGRSRDRGFRLRARRARLRAARAQARRVGSRPRATPWTSAGPRARRQDSGAAPPGARNRGRKRCPAARSA